MLSLLFCMVSFGLFLRPHVMPRRSVAGGGGDHAAALYLGPSGGTALLFAISTVVVWYRSITRSPGELSLDDIHSSTSLSR